MYRLILVVVLVALLVSVLAPVASASCPGCGGNGGWWQKAKAKAKSALNRGQSQQQRTFWGSGQAVRTGVPGIQANDLTTQEGRAAFQAPDFSGGAVNWIWDQTVRK